MKVYTQKGIYGEGNVYVLETLEDWKELEDLLKDQKNNRLEEFKKDFEKYIGKCWKKGNSIYKVIAMELNEAWCDWYWVVQNQDDQRDIEYLLVNGTELEEGLVEC